MIRSSRGRDRRGGEKHEREAALFVFVSTDLLETEKLAIEVKSLVQVFDANHRMQITHLDCPCFAEDGVYLSYSKLEARLRPHKRPGQNMSRDLRMRGGTMLFWSIRIS